MSLPDATNASTLFAALNAALSGPFKHRAPLRRWACAGLLGVVPAFLVAAPANTAMPGTAAAPVATPGKSTAPSVGVDWQSAASDADIERAMALARAARKPMLLYWGASWCPPCNQLKATLFNRQDFISRAQGFVAVHIDGDGAGAQKLGARFKVRGYPTLVLMSTDGQEITRLPGEADAPQVMAVLQAGLAGGRAVKAVLEDARAGKALTPAEWRMLAYYGWDVDEAQLVGAADRANLLAELSRRSPPSESQAGTRLLLKAVAESDDGKGLKPDAALRQRVLKLLADAKASRQQMDVLVNQADALARALAPEAGADRQAVAAGLTSALVRLQADASLSRADRLSALQAQIELARIDQPKTKLVPEIDPALQRQAQALAKRMDQEITDGYERQAVITAAAYLLGRAGLWADSDALLKAGLAKSHSAYYLMSQLGGNARKQGRTAEALDWYEQAFARSVGPATRLQWGASYVTAVLELSPQDTPRIERAVTQVLAEAGKDPAAFHERSARSLQRVSSRLAAWNPMGEHDALIQRWQASLQPACARLDAADGQRASCEKLLNPAMRGKL